MSSRTSVLLFATLALLLGSARFFPLEVEPAQPLEGLEGDVEQVGREP